VPVHLAPSAFVARQTDRFGQAGIEIGNEPRAAHQPHAQAVAGIVASIREKLATFFTAAPRHAPGNGVSARKIIETAPEVR